ncbi:unnamed protein product [Lepidochelys olivacea]
MIFTPWQLQEKCWEQNQPLYMAFFDLTKAFDSVNRHALWIILAKIGCPDKYVNVLQLLHDNMKATVLSSTGSQSEPFKVQTGVKQGCVIAPTMLVVFVTIILYLVAGKFTAGIEITYRMDRKLFRLSRLKAKSNISTTSIVEL